MSDSNRKRGIVTKVKDNIKKIKREPDPVDSGGMSGSDEEFRQRKRRQVLADLGRGVNRDAKEAEKVLPEYRDGLIRLIKSGGSATIPEEMVIKAFKPFTDFLPLLTTLRSDLRLVYGADIPQADVQIGEVISKFVGNRHMKSIYTKLAEDYDEFDLQIQSLKDTCTDSSAVSSGPSLGVRDKYFRRTSRESFSAQSSSAGSSSADSNASISPSSVKSSLMERVGSVRDALPPNAADVKGTVKKKAVSFKDEAKKGVVDMTMKVKKEAADIKGQVSSASNFKRKAGEVLQKATSLSPSNKNCPPTVDHFSKQSLLVPSTSTRVNRGTSGSRRTLNPFQSDFRMIRRAREVHRLPVDVLHHLETSLKQLITCTPANHPDAGALPKLVQDIEGLKTSFYSTWEKSAKEKSRVHANDWFEKQKKRILRRN